MGVIWNSKPGAVCESWCQINRTNSNWSARCSGWEKAAKTGAEAVMYAVKKPRNITHKGLTDLITDTDKKSEATILEVVRKNFEHHLILGDEGITGDISSDYMWCIDPLG